MLAKINSLRFFTGHSTVHKANSLFEKKRFQIPLADANGTLRIKCYCSSVYANARLQLNVHSVHYVKRKYAADSISCNLIIALHSMPIEGTHTKYNITEGKGKWRCL